MRTFTPSLSRRKQILKKVTHSHPQWKIRISIAVALWMVAVALIAGGIILLIRHPTSPEGVFIFIATDLCLACVPYIIALSVKNTAKFKCGLPYSSYANGILTLKNESLEYSFWRVGPQEPAAYSSKRAVYHDEDKFVYVIGKDAIRSISFKDDTCTIKGNGKVEMPEWAEEDLTVKRTCAAFSFALAFEQEDAERCITKWWDS